MQHGHEETGEDMEVEPEEDSCRCLEQRITGPRSSGAIPNLEPSSETHVSVINLPIPEAQTIPFIDLGYTANGLLTVQKRLGKGTGTLHVRVLNLQDDPISIQEGKNLTTASDIWP
jgi:hypothetical protein